MTVRIKADNRRDATNSIRRGDNLSEKEYQKYQTYNQITIQKKYPKSLLAKKSKPALFTMNQMAQASEQILNLVPIRIDVEQDGVKIRDDFTWNVNGII